MRMDRSTCPPTSAPAGAYFGRMMNEVSPATMSVGDVPRSSHRAPSPSPPLGCSRRHRPLFRRQPRRCCREYARCRTFRTRFRPGALSRLRGGHWCGRPGRSRRSESKFGKEGLRRCGIMDRRPDDAWRCLDEDPALHDSARSQVVAGSAKPDFWIRTYGHQFTGRSGARPSSSPGRRRSIRGAQWPDRPANRSALR